MGEGSGGEWKGRGRREGEGGEGSGGLGHHLSILHYRRCEERAPVVVAHLALLVQLVHSPAPISELRHVLRGIHQSDHYRGSRHHLTTSSGGGGGRGGCVYSVIPYLSVSVQTEPRNCRVCVCVCVRVCVCVCVCVCVYRGKILAFATISSTLVFPALWSPTTTTFGSWSTNLPVLD